MVKVIKNTTDITSAVNLSSDNNQVTHTKKSDDFFTVKKTKVIPSLNQQRMSFYYAKLLLHLILLIIEERKGERFALEAKVDNKNINLFQKFLADSFQ